MATDLSLGIIIGNLTRDAEFSHLQSGMALLKFTIANNKSFLKDRSLPPSKDNWKSKTMYTDCVVWGKYAESLSGKLTKGLKVCVKGRIDQNNWEDQNGNNRSKHFITIENVQKLYKPGEGASNSSGAGDVNGVDSPVDDVDPNNIPF